MLKKESLAKITKLVEEGKSAEALNLMDVEIAAVELTENETGKAVSLLKEISDGLDWVESHYLKRGYSRSNRSVISGLRRYLEV
jgi:hypothetical protein